MIRKKYLKPEPFMDKLVASLHNPDSSYNVETYLKVTINS
jgi:hypothetical protein